MAAPESQASTWAPDIPVASLGTETATPEVRTLVLEVTDSADTHLVTLRLGLTDDQGNWRRGVLVEPLRVLDDPENRDPVLAQAAMHMTDLILTARVDGANPLAEKFGVTNNTSLGLALAQIGWGLLYPGGPVMPPAVPEVLE